MSTSAGYSLIDRIVCAKSVDRHTWCIIGLCLFCLVVLFFDVGGAALFEPDEGRNAEVAREVLLLDDWITPHYDFIPRLDKPIFFFGLVALSFKIFGSASGRLVFLQCWRRSVVFHSHTFLPGLFLDGGGAVERVDSGDQCRVFCPLGW